MFEQAKSLYEYLDTLPEPMSPQEQGMVAYSNMIDEISMALIEYRMQNNLNQSQLAKELKCSQSLISAYENGERNISIAKLCQLMAGIGKRASLKLEDDHAEGKMAEEPPAYMTNPTVPEYDSFAA